MWFICKTIRSESRGIEPLCANLSIGTFLSLIIRHNHLQLLSCIDHTSRVRLISYFYNSRWNFESISSWVGIHIQLLYYLVTSFDVAELEFGLVGCGLVLIVISSNSFTDGVE